MGIGCAETMDGYVATTTAAEQGAVGFDFCASPRTVAVFLILLLGTVSASSNNVEHRWTPNDKVFISGRQVAVVAKELSAMLEFYRAALLDANGDPQAGRKLLVQLFDENRIKSVQKDTHAIVLNYATPTGIQKAQYPHTPWARLVRIRMLDGEKPGLEVWTDDSEFHRE